MYQRFHGAYGFVSLADFVAFYSHRVEKKKKKPVHGFVLAAAI
jgi:hypothetical protein